MDTLYTLIIWALMLLVGYGIYTYVRSAFHVDPQRKPVKSLKEKSTDAEFSEEVTHFPEWETKTAAPDTELPHSYNKDSLVLMARDPDWLYAYWEITAAKQQEISQEYGLMDNKQAILRVYEVSDIDKFDGINANSYRDLDISGYVNNWYIRVDSPDKNYCVDYGFKLDDGRFIVILRSNFVSTPRAFMSDIVDNEWRPIDELYPDVHRCSVSSESRCTNNR